MNFLVFVSFKLAFDAIFCLLADNNPRDTVKVISVAIILVFVLVFVILLLLVFSNNVETASLIRVEVA